MAYRPPLTPQSEEHSAVYRVPCPHADCDSDADVTITLDEHHAIIGVTVDCRAKAFLDKIIRGAPE